MLLANIKHNDQQVTFEQAVKIGLGRDQGLFFPQKITPLENLSELLAMPFVERSGIIISHLLNGEINVADATAMIKNAFEFPAPLANVTGNIYNLELFHGPTLAFKDFGARFMAQCLSRFSQDGKLTILTATSGDTGAAVAHAFHGIDNIRVVILYPKGKISLLQEKMFCTLGGNIETIAVEGDFDDCQALVKASFEDQELRQEIGLNSANSINISRLFAQVCYYFEAISQLPAEQQDKAVISVPSGNFGNLTAGIIAKVLGLPIKRFIAATNANDTVPRYLATGEWKPKTTVATLSNAMDVSQPNNWPRVEFMIEQGWFDKSLLSSYMIDEDLTQMGVKELYQMDYLSEPHGAIAYKALKHEIKEGEVGIFLGTAHPAKFKESVENILGELISLPKELADVAGKTLLSSEMAPEFAKLRAYLTNQ
ncbi:threonine synthase [Psychrosphaera sp. B3R10]|uniref:threonine synthase n=1 Tax=unclassified Psychrosphaera TaxID=2641570 RepID=UPI001C094B56|nr:MULTISPECIES: threonine synthase [unclassified Psychrosphaera]MBU2882979.1 threonine synthase [Psychrosphaera sp. I2R16]MBU2991376.1 threonine synthase [Psychrosphaera sp. B3R10]MDO6720265.1 threonine synthase [Psychrosphaera sp. 1_MG-2023]